MNHDQINLVSNKVSIRMGKDSFELNKRSNNTVIFGWIETTHVFELNSLELNFIGQAKAGNKIGNLMKNIVCLLTPKPSDWKSTGNNYQLPFQLTIPSYLPVSTHLEQFDGIYYYLKLHDFVQPIHLHSNSLYLDHSKLLWGRVDIWRYEIEFQNIYRMTQPHYQLDIRLKSMFQHIAKERHSCTIEFQIIQSIQKEGHDVQYQIVTNKTKTIDNPHSTWKTPYTLSFDITPNDYSYNILPTTSTDFIEIQHDIKLSFLIGDQYILHLDLPVTMIGYTHELLHQNKANCQFLYDSNSLSSSYSTNTSSSNSINSNTVFGEFLLSKKDKISFLELSALL